MSDQTQEQFAQLMRAGRKAYDAGDSTAAHDYWRQAAVIDPYNEKVWLALYRVVETEDDRKACLENIIAINPANVQARRRLRRFDATLGRRLLQELAAFKKEEKRRTRRGFLFGYLLLVLYMAGVVALVNYLTSIGG
ncbi:MAG: hypothetical protein D6737_19115 [Chloroflexi bacterium]|nr:MAG: hypothetical protein CUN54_06825 [Phototrophicales bacterium]RMF76950.1 MAG: hypothetical protein D6737_19115 [Chloroflexota bacterium]